MDNLKDFKLFVKKLSDESGIIIKNYFRTPIKVDTKGDLSPVTLADKKAEEKMREMIMKEFPEHGILGEEFGVHNPDAEFHWVLDPIDGTKSFICGTTQFGTLIALLKKDVPILGAINQPVLNEFLIGDNKFTELNGKKVNVRDCKKLSEAVLITTDILDIEKYWNMDKFMHLIRQVKLFRGWGDCFGYYLLSTGFADVMIDPIMSVWDTMALIPIIKGAGGIITDYTGGDPAKGSSIIAASPKIFKSIIEALN